MVVIHTRKGNGLQVSTQKVVMCSDQFTQLFDTEAAMNAAIASYGQDNEVPLDPSFNPATAVRVTYNGSQIWQSGQGRVFIDASEGGELVIQGQNLNSEKNWVTFLADGASQAVRYTPLWVDSSGWHYLLTSNGSATVIINEYVACGVKLSGIETPSDLASYRQMWMIDSDSSSINAEGRYNNEVVYRMCINYAHKTTAESRFVVLTRFVTAPASTDDFVYVNCSKNTESTYSNEWRINVSVTDASKVAYVTYKGFIIAVFNYA